ncbi:MAG: hypothetical protein ACREPW_06885 [Candidatus Binataceae bacterium]
MFFWNSNDLHRKLESFRNYYNARRTHQALPGSHTG